MARLLQRSLVLIVVGTLFGLVNNAVSPRRIPLIAPPKKAPPVSEYLPLDKAHELWGNGTTIFLDAREPEDFEAGHIANAMNLPVQHFDEHFPRIAPMLAPDTGLVVYCDGPECELSHRLAEQLRQRGFGNVHMLFNGWTAWRTAGYPTESGAK